MREIHHVAAAYGVRQPRKDAFRQPRAEHEISVYVDDACAGALVQRVGDFLQNGAAPVWIYRDVFRRIVQYCHFTAELIFGEARHVCGLACDDLLHRHVQKMIDLVLHEDRANAESDDEHEKFGGDLQERVAVAVVIRQGTPPPLRTNPCGGSARRPGGLPLRRRAGRPAYRESAL